MPTISAPYSRFLSDPLRDVEKSLSPRVLGTHLPWDLAPTPVREGKVKVTTLIYTNYSSNIYILNLGNKMAREGGRFLSFTHFMVQANICLMSQPHEWLILQTQCYCYRLFIVSETLKMWQAVLIRFLTKTGVISGLTWDRFICNYMAGNGKY